MSKDHQTNDEISRLLRLKRYETPPDGYFERFADELRTNQRADALRGSAFTLLRERVIAWLDLVGKPRLAYGVTAAYVALALALVIGLRSQGGRGNAVDTLPVSAPAVSPKPQIAPIDIRSDAENERLERERAARQAQPQR